MEENTSLIACKTLIKTCIQKFCIEELTFLVVYQKLSLFHVTKLYLIENDAKLEFSSTLKYILCSLSKCSLKT